MSYCPALEYNVRALKENNFCLLRSSLSRPAQRSEMRLMNEVQLMRATDEDGVRAGVMVDTRVG